MNNLQGCLGDRMHLTFSAQTIIDSVKLPTLLLLTSVW